MLADMLILAALLSRPMHGYEIKKAYDQTLGGLVTLHHNQLYPALRRFEEMGVVRREAIEQQGKPDRHIYHLTDHGLSELREMLRDFPHTIARNDMDFYVRFALFGFLEPEDRVKILQTRIQALQSLILEKGRYQKYLDSPIVGKVQPYVEKLNAFNDQRIQTELEWLARMIEQVQFL
ncbi:PadR family transcriptional regulator [Ktedonobacter sp. SOSP1-52]|uniref:PadR family transcriptional regulator n=1 Tax=Ktedonobacter sp. SOSP1-52 TaxID=2778366 RepID=UPI0019168DF0|nr:PadR family transcriptional regulator [Ktedonobacter sp. SOSP1-52]GHO67910.1 PadR family transcriptional regulator [Ktedonobacter sp. SOSP1-52]